MNTAFLRRGLACALALLGCAALASACSSSDDPVQASCTGPNCAGTCEVGKTACGTSCVDLQTDRLDCGACGATCTDAETCKAGTCVCNDNLTSCSGPSERSCVNVRSDVANCGSCGHACNGDETCFGGSCVCAGASVTCGGQCTDPQTNEDHCGATEGCGEGGRGSAGVACKAGFFCRNGTCTTCASWRDSAEVATGPVPNAVAAADLDGDGSLDMVVQTSVGIDVFRGSGGGNFDVVQRIAGPGSGSDVALADLDGDGTLDITVAGQVDQGTGTIIAYGFGDGTFDPELTRLARPGPSGQTSGLAVVDLNGDGRLDIFVTDSSLPGYAIIFNQGNRNFATAVDVSTNSYGPTQPALGDLDGDAKLDLVMANGNNTSTVDIKPSKVEIYHGNGDGTFERRQSYDNGLKAYSVALADLDGDGRLDIVTANWSNGQSLLGQGDGTFVPGLATSTVSGTTTVIAKDVNGDSIIDLVYGGGRHGLRTAKTTEVRIGAGDGSFFAPIPLEGGAGGLTIADVDADGRQDILVVDKANNQIKVYLGVANAECH